MVALLLCLFVPLNNAFAIGKWRKGTVTQEPWTGDYTFVKIDDVKYTIMDKVKVSFVYEKNGAQYKDKISVSSIHMGDAVVVKVEGNRIYQIEKIR
jgi:hypothetical protein